MKSVASALANINNQQVCSRMDPSEQEDSPSSTVKHLGHELCQKKYMGDDCLEVIQRKPVSEFSLNYAMLDSAFLSRWNLACLTVVRS